jgi:hypothetical protein
MSNDSNSAIRHGRDRPYIEGTVWSIQFTRTLPGLSKEYLRTLGSEWKPVMEEAKRRGLIRDYRVLIAPLGHREDWDVMLMVEVDNMAALDGHNDRMEDLVIELRGSAGCAGLQETNGRPPDLVGMKLLREITLM